MVLTTFLHFPACTQSAFPVAATGSQRDHKVYAGKLGRSIASDRPWRGRSRPHGAVAQTDPETEPKELMVKQITFRPQPPPLLVLDLNGCLLYRKSTSRSPKIIYPRPYLDELFKYLSAPHPKGDDSGGKVPNWEVMIWSSAMTRNVKLMCEAIQISKRPPVRRVEALRESTNSENQTHDISRLDSLANNKIPSEPKQMTVIPAERTVMDVWSRCTLDLPFQDYHRHVSTVKDLRKVWETFSWTDPSTGEQIKWGSHNTVVVDDSPDKLTLQPDNLCLIPEFRGNPHDQSILQLIRKLKLLRNESNIPEALNKLQGKSNWYQSPMKWNFLS